MKEYNFFNSTEEFFFYTDGHFYGKGIGFNPPNTNIIQNGKAYLFMNQKSGVMDISIFGLEPNPIQFALFDILDKNIKKDSFQYNLKTHSLSIQIQSMTDRKMHVMITDTKSKKPVIFSGAVEKQQSIIYFLKRAFCSVN